jgi:hypothetical protein
MRPTGDTGKFAVATDVQGNKTRVIVSALGKDDEFINDRTMVGHVLGPDMEPIPLDIEQVAPGRYVGEFESTKPGSYMIMVLPGGDQGAIRTGISIGYSDEFRDRETNETLLESIAKLPAKQGEPGKLLPPLPEVPDESDRAEQVLQPQLTVDPFRRDLPLAVATQDIWPWLVLCGSCVFFADVFVRRVQLDLRWLEPFWTRFAEIVLRRERHEAAPETMARLRSRKAEVDRSLDSQRAAARFEPDATIPIDPTVIEGAEAKRTAPINPSVATPKVAAETEQKDTYTSRLLKAKKQVWRDRGLSQDKGPSDE